MMTPQWSARIRYERVDDQRYIIYLGEDNIGSVEHVNEREWRATSTANRTQSFHTRGEAADWLRRVNHAIPTRKSPRRTRV